MQCIAIASASDATSIDAVAVVVDDSGDVAPTVVAAAAAVALPVPYCTKGRHVHR